MKTPLNIVYLHCHDAGRYIQPYGYAIPTPHLQAFAEQATVFRHAFCTAPTCSPSRAALLTGQYPHQCGMFNLANHGGGLYDPSRHLASFLHRHGYKTVLSGMQHETGHSLEAIQGLGYEQVLTMHDYGDANSPRADDAAVAFLGDSHDRPFFLSVGFGEPHRDNSRGGSRFSYMPGIEHVPANDKYCRAPEPIPDNVTTRNDMAQFIAAAGILDKRMGSVIDAIDRSGKTESTMVIITTDHGIAWPHGKGNLTDMGLGVMLMMRGPDEYGLTKGTVIDGMVSHIDIYPTLCELLEIEKPQWLEGKSLLPLQRNQKNEIHDYIFGEQTHHAKKTDPQRSVRTKRYKYIRRMDCNHLRIVDPGPTNDWMRSIGFREQPYDNELLYDLWLDPLEIHNCATDPGYNTILEEMRNVLNDWMEQTDDPFRKGIDAIP